MADTINVTVIVIANTFKMPASNKLNERVFPVIELYSGNSNFTSNMDRPIANKNTMNVSLINCKKSCDLAAPMIFRTPISLARCAALAVVRFT